MPQSNVRTRFSSWSFDCDASCSGAPPPPSFTPASLPHSHISGCQLPAPWRRPAFLFLREAWPSGRAFALATDSSLWRLRCRRGARLATRRLCVPAAVPPRYFKMSAVKLLEAASRKQRPTCHSQISGPGSLPGPLTATLPAPPFARSRERRQGPPTAHS